MSEPKRLTPALARALVSKKWDAHHARWLVQPRDEASWPLSFNLHSLTEKDVLKDLPGTREWVASWRQWDAGGTVEWAPRRWSSGDQELPARLVLAGPQEVAKVLGHTEGWSQAQQRYAAWCGQFPLLQGSRAVTRNCDEVFTGYSEPDFLRLTALLQWFADHPRSGLYLRQLPVADVDTKWVERRKGVVGDLVRQLLGVSPEADFHALCGLRCEPARLRMRILCPRLRLAVGGLCDIEAPAAEIAALRLEPTISLVVENLNTGIALPDIDGAVAFMRLGLAVDQLEPISWLRNVPSQLYWGDIDTHGFAALARARRRFPRIVSVLMDERTLIAHRGLWVREPVPSRVESPEGLTIGELAVYEGLRSNTWGEQIRLEQERIAWSDALDALMEP